MATASDILSAIAPQFDDATGRQTIIDLSESRTSTTRFGDRRAEAVAYRAAHTMALTSQTGAWANGGAGAITSKSEGSLSVSFGSTSSRADRAYLSQTGYGLALLEIIDSCGPVMGITGQPFTPFSVAGYRP